MDAPIRQWGPGALAMKAQYYDLFVWLSLPAFPAPVRSVFRFPAISVNIETLTQT